MKAKRISIGIVISILLLTVGTVFADEANEKFEYGCFTATVTNIEDHSNLEDAKFISLEDKEGLPINMIVTKDTYIIGNKEIEIGDTISGYFNKNLPMITIYPPQYGPEVIVIENNRQNVKVDRFDKNLVSEDNMLKLLIAKESDDNRENTKIITKDGEDFIGGLGNKRLAVIYEESTDSIPAQTIPSKVIVLSEISKEEEKTLFHIGSAALVVNGDRDNIQGISLHTVQTPDLSRVIMLPLRQVTKELGIEVKWIGNNKPIQIGENTFIEIGKVITSLEVAPQLISEKDNIWKTYVPLEFFTKVLDMKDAYALDGDIVINQ